MKKFCVSIFLCLCFLLILNCFNNLLLKQICFAEERVDVVTMPISVEEKDFELMLEVRQTDKIKDYKETCYRLKNMGFENDVIAKYLFTNVESEIDRIKKRVRLCDYLCVAQLFLRNN